MELFGERVPPSPLSIAPSLDVRLPKGWNSFPGPWKRAWSVTRVVLEYGGNDCDYDWAAISAHPQGIHQPHTPLPEFVRCCREMIRMLRARGILPIVMSLPPIDAQRYFDWFCRQGLDKPAVLRWLGGDLADHLPPSGDVFQRFVPHSPGGKGPAGRCAHVLFGGEKLPGASLRRWHPSPTGRGTSSLERCLGICLPVSSARLKFQALFGRFSS